MAYKVVARTSPHPHDSTLTSKHTPDMNINPVLLPQAISITAPDNQTLPADYAFSDPDSGCMTAYRLMCRQ